MASTHDTTYTHIVRIPGVVGGEPVIEGTRVPVRCIVIAFRLYGSLERVLEAYPRVSREAAEEALSYYEANRAEIDRYIQENEDEAYSSA